MLLILFVNKQNITHFFNVYSQLNLIYQLLELEKFYCLLLYYEFFTGNYVKILIKKVDSAVIKIILQKNYKESNFD